MFNLKLQNLSLLYLKFPNSYQSGCTHPLHYDFPTAYCSVQLNADKHSPASSARSTKRRVKGDAYVDRSRSDCVHEQVAKLGPVSRAAGMDCECPLYVGDLLNSVKKGCHAANMTPLSLPTIKIYIRTDDAYSASVVSSEAVSSVASSVSSLKSPPMMSSSTSSNASSAAARSSFICFALS